MKLSHGIELPYNLPNSVAEEPYPDSLSGYLYGLK